ncbi:MAG: putative glycoside hydrolase [Patescibacteria group bacterium]
MAVILALAILLSLPVFSKGAPAGAGKKEEPTAPSEQALVWKRPETVRGIYATGWTAGSTKNFSRLVRFIQETQVNSIVIDVKDDGGTLSYKSLVPLARETGADIAKIKDPRALLRSLNRHGIWPIARIVAFKDPHLARKRPDLAVRNKAGGYWRDRKGMLWVDPNARYVWEYNVAVAKEAVAMGFQEIQFDYVRFTSDGCVSDCVYPYSKGAKKEDVIRDFLAYARAALKPLGIPVSADIFGLVTTAQDDLGIGQLLEKIAASVDIISPMVYPSHYARGSFGLANPDLHPYETVLRGLTDARRRLAQNAVEIRPWLQDFSLGNPYGRAEIQAQIKAVRDAGLREWIFWNPSNRYDAAKY